MIVSIVLVVNLLAAFCLTGILLSYLNNAADRDIVFIQTATILYVIMNIVAGFVSLDDDQKLNQERACTSIVKEGTLSRVELANGDFICIVEGGPNIVFAYKVKEQ